MPGGSCVMVQVGMAGELMVSGIQLAREYLHNPEKTAASFIPNPHNHDDHPNHTRVYRTGTVPAQRYTSSGSLSSQVFRSFQSF